MTTSCNRLRDAARAKGTPANSSAMDAGSGMVGFIAEKSVSIVPEQLPLQLHAMPLSASSIEACWFWNTHAAPEKVSMKDAMLGVTSNRKPDVWSAMIWFASSS